MDRRDFITRILGGAAAPLVLPPVASTFGKAQTFDRSYRAILESASREFDRQYRKVFGAAPQMIGGDRHLIGESASGRLITDQLSVFCPMDETTPETLTAAMATLLRQVQDYNLDAFARLHLPDVVDYAGICGPVRLCVVPNGWPSGFLRFDVLGARRETVKGQL